MTVKRPYSKEAAQYQQTNSQFGFGLSLAQAGLSVSFVNGKVLVTDPKTGQTREITKAQWNALASQGGSASVFESAKPKKDEIGASLGKGTVEVSGGFIAIVNTNQARDDNFDIYLDGTRLFLADFSFENEYTGYIVTFLSSSARTIGGAFVDDYVGAPVVYRQSIQIERPATAYPGQSSQLFFQNAQENNNGNYGQVFYGFTGGDRVLVADIISYSPSNGSDATLTLYWGEPNQNLV